MEPVELPKTAQPTADVAPAPKPAAPAATAQQTPKPPKADGPKKPVVAITVATAIFLALMAVAYYAYTKSK